MLSPVEPTYWHDLQHGANILVKCTDRMMTVANLLEDRIGLSSADGYKSLIPYAKAQDS